MFNPAQETAQFFERKIAQLNLVRKLLVRKDENLFPVALITVDHVVESALHHWIGVVYAKLAEQQLFEQQSNAVSIDAVLLKKAMSQTGLDAKINFAKKSKLLSSAHATVIRLLHKHVRNSTQHQDTSIGLWFESPLIDSMTALYHEIAYKLLLNVISAHPRMSLSALQEPVFKKLVANYAGILAEDMGMMIKYVDDVIVALASASSPSVERKDVVQALHAECLATCKKEYARKNGCDSEHPQQLQHWFKENYKRLCKTDPIPGWEKRQRALMHEQDPYAATVKYFQFLRDAAEWRNICYFAYAKTALVAGVMQALLSSGASDMCSYML